MLPTTATCSRTPIDAFAQMARDPRFIEEAARRDVLVNYQSPEDLAEIVEQVVTAPPEMIMKYNELVGE